jgi:hypothetical protein
VQFAPNPPAVTSLLTTMIGKSDVVLLASRSSEALPFGQHAVALGARFADGRQLALCRYPQPASVPSEIED